MNILNLPVEISEQSLLNRIAGNQKNISKRIKSAVKKAVFDIKESTEGKVLYKVFPLQKRGKGISLDGQLTIKSRKLYNVFEECEKVIVFVSTIGNNVEEKIKSNKNNKHYSFVLDQAASLAAEKTAQRFHGLAQEKLSEDEGVTHRYSPGYCDWPVEEQKKLFKVIPHEKIGVKLASNSMMSPVKSISGIIGVGERDYIKENGIACHFCSNANCPYRRGSSDI
jgi:hypothetical protein